MVPRRAASAAAIPPTLLLYCRCCHGGGGGAPFGRPAALPGLGLVEDLAHHQLPLLLLFEIAEVVLVHHPVGLLRFPLFSIATVQHQDLLAPLLPAVHHYRPRLSGLVPPRLALVDVALRLYLPPLPRARRIGL